MAASWKRATSSMKWRHTPWVVEINDHTRGKASMKERLVHVIFGGNRGVDREEGGTIQNIVKEGAIRDSRTPTFFWRFHTNDVRVEHTLTIKKTSSK